MTKRTKQIEAAILKIREQKPGNVGAFRQIGLKLKKLGQGMFREAYQIVDLPLVVKFPKWQESDGEASMRSGKLHSTVEVRKIGKLRKSRWMKKYVPEVHYHDRKTGVLVVSLHSKFTSSYNRTGAMGRLITEMIVRHFGINVGDIHAANVGRGKGQTDAVLIDLGY